ncbi:TetR/AcrR family transcriptional regulator [Kaistia nematophila]|uniref:Helix-turn-helix domain containing protein n=1 Tax=Kaistia nematophila TaxID=2994654 RepID=A0A9X3E380_9HYPH|nr:TetR/AcrR family transcriptional regulator [Kaistia nematophila]MCX5570689.1 helix-turn-helix domain containing protein [Kaistia nematophila]
MKQDTPSRGGRPRGFDRDGALDVAMRLFWRHGYEGVSIGELTRALDIAPPSLYAAFGSKAGLYEEALRRYEALVSVELPQPGDAATLEDAVRQMLEASVRAVTDPAGELGCMISTGMISAHAEHEDLARAVSDRRNRYREAMLRTLARWTGEAEAAALARYLTAVMQGLSVQARDGAGADALSLIVDEVLAGLRARRQRAG